MLRQSNSSAFAERVARLAAAATLGCSVDAGDLDLGSKSSNLSLLDAPIRVALQAVADGLPAEVDFQNRQLINYSRTVVDGGCEIHEYTRAEFVYDLVALQPFECPSSLSVEVIAAPGGSSPDLFAQSSPEVPFWQVSDVGGVYVCSFRAASFTVELWDAADPSCGFQCVGDCASATPLARYEYSGLLGTGAARWFVVSESINGWQASEMAGRTIRVNGVEVAPYQLPLPERVGGKYYFEFGDGSHPWASWSFW